MIMELMELLREKISEVIKKSYKLDMTSDEIDVSHPGNELWGDYSTNIAMRLSKEVKQTPTEIAKKLSYELSQDSHAWQIDGVECEMFEKIDFQDPGFINFTLSEKFLTAAALTSDEKLESQKGNLNIGQYRGRNVLFEYTDPNPFKVFHIGHLMTNTLGEALSRMYEISGANVKRVNYQGDVGLHVAKSIWGVLKKPLPLDDKVGFFADGYVMGEKAYETDPKSKDEIHQLNYLIYIAAQERLQKEENWKPVVDYKKFLNESHTFSYEEVKELYEKGRKWSLEHFEKMYKILGTKFDAYYFESMVGEYGLKIVNDNLGKGVFKKDEGAIIFPGEKYGLHTRVFVNSFGLPTYEAKDLGLAILKSESFDYDLSFIITANEVDEYFKVVLKAMEQIKPDLAAKTVHIGHGVMRFKEGKMSSRTGEIVSAEEFIEDVKKMVSEPQAIGAIKYSILKQGMGKDIIFDKNQSVSITGNTGPYLQYTHARANSILEKAPKWSYNEAPATFQEREKNVLRHLVRFHDILSFALLNNSPNLICEYLFELAQRYNALYNDLQILKEPNEQAKILRLQITKQVRDLLKTGLWILGIEAPERV